MSAPDPRLPDATRALPEFLRAYGKFRDRANEPEALRINGHPRDLDQTESEVMPNAGQYGRSPSISGLQTQTNDTSPESATRGDQINPLDDIGLGLRSLTWDQFVRLAETWKADPAVIWQWAVTHGN